MCVSGQEREHHTRVQNKKSWWLAKHKKEELGFNKVQSRTWDPGGLLKVFIQNVIYLTEFQEANLKKTITFNW